MCVCCTLIQTVIVCVGLWYARCTRGAWGGGMVNHLLRWYMFVHVQGKEEVDNITDVCVHVCVVLGCGSFYVQYWIISYWFSVVYIKQTLVRYYLSNPIVYLTSPNGHYNCLPGNCLPGKYAMILETLPTAYTKSELTH